MQVAVSDTKTKTEAEKKCHSNHWEDTSVKSENCNESLRRQDIATLVQEVSNVLSLSTAGIVAAISRQDGSETTTTAMGASIAVPVQKRKIPQV